MIGYYNTDKTRFKDILTGKVIGSADVENAVEIKINGVIGPFDDTIQCIHGYFPNETFAHLRIPVTSFNETIVASQVIQSIASGKITVNCTSIAHVGGIVGANDSLVVNEMGYSGYLQNNFSLCTYELSEGVTAGGIVGRAGKYGYDNNYHTSGNNDYYYYKDNYFLQLSSPINGIRALYDGTNVLEEGYTLSTTPATNEEINANETFKKIINLFY